MCSIALLHRYCYLRVEWLIGDWSMCRLSSLIFLLVSSVMELPTQHLGFVWKNRNIKEHDTVDHRTITLSQITDHRSQITDHSDKSGACFGSHLVIALDYSTLSAY